MEKVVKGKAWKFGHNIDKDADVFPFQYVRENHSGVPIEELVIHTMENLNPEFGKNVRKGDFVVAGRNFGYGKDHIQAAESLKVLGVAAVIADSIASSFFKEGVYFALPMLASDGVSEKIRQDDELEVNIQTGEIKNLSTGETFRANPAIPEGHPLCPIMQAGGQIEYTKKKVASSKKA